MYRITSCFSSISLFVRGTIYLVVDQSAYSFTRGKQLVCLRESMTVGLREKKSTAIVYMSKILTQCNYKISKSFNLHFTLM